MFGYISFHTSCLASLHTNISDPLKQRQHDSDENVRMDVIQAIVGAGKKDPTNLTDGLLECVRERTLDKKVGQIENE